MGAAGFPPGRGCPKAAEGAYPVGTIRSGPVIIPRAQWHFLARALMRPHRGSPASAVWT